MVRRVTGWGLALALLTISVSAELQTPTDWKWRTDAPANVTSESKITPDTWHFVAMPPGWHITMGPGGVLYPAGKTVSGNFALQAEIFLFPGDSQQEYGLFLGGREIEPEGSNGRYLAFVVRRDGHAAVLWRTPRGTEFLVPWTPHAAVVAHPGGTGTAKNVLRVEVGPKQITFSANGKDVLNVTREGISSDGMFGFRVGKDLNLHISTLDVTERLAPIPVKK